MFVQKPQKGVFKKHLNPHCCQQSLIRVVNKPGWL